MALDGPCMEKDHAANRQHHRHGPRQRDEGREVVGYMSEDMVREERLKIKVALAAGKKTYKIDAKLADDILLEVLYLWHDCERLEMELSQIADDRTKQSFRDGFDEGRLDGYSEAVGRRRQ